ncbi:MAG: nitroreductase family protein [Bacillota bacterium]
MLNAGFYEVTARRRTVRSFVEKDIEKEKLTKILECGLKAPTYDHMRDWHYIFLKTKDIRREILEKSGAFSRTPDKKFLDETLKKLRNEHQKAVYSYSVPLQEKMLLTAPEVLLVCFKMKKKLAECNTLFDLNDFASAWLVVENILLAMAAEGLYGVTMVPFRTDGVKNILGIPEDIEIATFIPFGYPAKEPSVKQINKELSDIVHINKW